MTTANPEHSHRIPLILYGDLKCFGMKPKACANAQASFLGEWGKPVLDVVNVCVGAGGEDTDGGDTGIIIIKYGRSAANESTPEFFIIEGISLASNVFNFLT